MKHRTFTVLFTEEYDIANGVVMTDEEAVKELRDNLQAACEDGELSGFFLVTKVQNGDKKFWKHWNKKVRHEQSTTRS